MKKLNLDEMKTVVLAVLLMIIGILFCCSIAMGIGGLSVIIGLVLMVVGVLFLLNTLLNASNLYSVECVVGVLALALGILFIDIELAGIIFWFIPWVLIVGGIIVLADCILGKIVRKTDSTFIFVLKLVVGIVALILGLCLRLINGFMEYSSIILGVLMIAYSLYMLVQLFTKSRA